MKRTWHIVWPALLFTVAALLLYRQMWWGVDGQLLWFGWDCPEAYWSDIVYGAHSIRRAELSLWNPYERGGYPFHADFSVGLFYPFSWLFFLAGALFPPVSGPYILAKAMLHLVIGPLGLFVFLRSRKIPVAAALVAGVGLLVSAPMIIHKASALLWPLVWAPWVWLAIDRLIHATEQGRNRLTATVVLGAVTGCAANAAPPHGFFFLLLTAIPYGIYGVSVSLGSHSRERRQQAMSIALALLGAALLAAALIAPLYLPGWLTSLDTPRAHRPLSYSLSVPLANKALIGLLAPTLGVTDAYLGVPLLVLAMTGAFAAPRSDRGRPLFFFLLGALLLSFAFGAKTPLLPFLVKYVPGFDVFRVVNRYKCPAAFCLITAAAYGVSYLLSADRRLRRWATVFVGTLTLAVLGIILAWKWGVRSAAHAPIGLSLTWLLVGGSLLIAMGLIAQRWRRLGLVLSTALVVVVFFDSQTLSVRNIRVSEKPWDHLEDRRFFADLPDVERKWRLYDEFLMNHRPGTRFRIRNLRDGYPSLAPLADNGFRVLLSGIGAHPELLRAFNVRWVLYGRHYRNGYRSHFLKGPPASKAPHAFVHRGGHLHEAVDPAPLVAWYGSVQAVGSRKQALKALAAMELPQQQRNRAVLIQADLAQQSDSLVNQLRSLEQAEPGAAAGRLLDYRADSLSVEIDAPLAGVVVTNEKYWPGWKAHIDGKPAESFRVNLFLRGLVVGPGLHRIEWRYRPTLLYVLLVPWLMALLFILYGLVRPKIARAATRGA